MAEVVLQIVLKKLVAMATEEVALLGSVRVQVHKLVDDLEAMKAFLIDTKDRCNHGSGESRHGFNVWVKQVREVSYDTEDAVEEFLVHISQATRCYPRLLELKARHRLCSRIQDIRSKISSISERRNAFSLMIHGGTLNSCPRSAMLFDPRTDSLWIDDADIVGIDVTKEILTNWLLEEESRLTATFVIGMGGLGKTTLVKKVFDSNLVSRNFNHRAWVTVSKSYNACELLRATLKAFKNTAQKTVEPYTFQMMSDVELVEALRSHLDGKRFIITLDDVWSVNAYRVLKYALPNSNCGSRILITTRNDDITTYFDIPVHIHQLQPLQEKEAWTLFCMKTFRGDEYKGICPKDLQDMSLSILKRCGGLPLAIVAMSGMLSRKNKTMLEWKIVCDNLATELKRDKNLEGLWTILLLSYDDLPYYLKICYLYFSVFPEDYLIKRSKIVRLWVTERFVEEEEGLTLEEVAEGYLNEFVSRNMIQAVEMDEFNRVNSCRVHDIMREILQLKSKEEALVEVLSEQHVNINTKVRRISIIDSFEGLQEINKIPPHTWSMLLFTTQPADFLLNRAFFGRFKLLRVVHLERACISEFPELLVKLIHLRYLSLRNTRIRMLPESIGKLKNLEIFDLKGTLVSSLPVGILQLKQLRQFCKYRFRYGLTFPDLSEMSTVLARIGCLTKLEKLANIPVSDNRAIISEMGKLRELRKLRLIGLRGNIGSDVCASLSKLSKLKALYMSSESPGIVVDLSSLWSPPQFLQNVWLRFRLITLPNWIASLNYLAKLVLQNSDLKQDPLETLQYLPSLVLLTLRDAYNGKELRCAYTGYPKLKNLQLNSLPNLESIKVLIGAMPELREMRLIRCEKLKMVPQGIENFKKLKYLHIQDMPPKFCRRLKRGEGEDFWKVQHVPNMSLNYDRPVQ